MIIPKIVKKIKNTIDKMLLLVYIGNCSGEFYSFKGEVSDDDGSHFHSAG
jgi:hypothetical protein